MTNDQAHIEIDGRIYTIDAFRGREGWKYLPKITKFVMPIVESLGGTENVDEASAMSGIANLLSGDSADEIFQLVQDLMSNVTIDGQKINFDREFAQRYDVLLKLTLEVLKLNYLESFQRLATTFSQ